MQNPIKSIVQAKEDALTPLLSSPGFVHTSHLAHLESEIVRLANNWHAGVTPELLPIIMAFYEGCYLNRTSSTKSLENVNRFVANLLKVAAGTTNSKTEIILKTYHTFGTVLLHLINGNYPTAFAFANSLDGYARKFSKELNLAISSLIAEAYHRHGSSSAAESIWSQVSLLDKDLHYFALWGLPYLSLLDSKGATDEINLICREIENQENNLYAKEICGWFSYKQIGLENIKVRTNSKEIRRSILNPNAQLDLWAEYLQSNRPMLKKLLFQPESIRKYCGGLSLSWQAFRPGMRLLGQINTIIKFSKNQEQLAEAIAAPLSNLHLLPTKELSEKYHQYLCSILMDRRGQSKPSSIKLAAQ